MRVAVCGATGAVGTIMLDVLRRRGFPADEVVPFATERSEGRTLDNADAPVRVMRDDTIEGFDLALRLTAQPAPGLVARRIAPLRWVTCAAPGYLAAHGTPGIPQDLLGHDCLTYGGLPATGSWRYRLDGEIVTVPVTGRARSNQASVVHQMGVAGLGVIRFPSYVVQPDLAARRLVPLLERFAVDDDAALHAVWLPNRWMQPKVRVFVDFVLERFGGLDDRP